MDRIEAASANDPRPRPVDVTHALWSACAGGQLWAVHDLVEHGADLNWLGWDDLTPLEAAERADAGDVANWLLAGGAKRAAEID